VLAFDFRVGFLDPVQGIEHDLLGDAFVAVADEKEVVDVENLVERAQEISSVAVVQGLTFVGLAGDFCLQVFDEVTAGAAVKQLAEFDEAGVFLFE
jgi:hypothetical protein